MSDKYERESEINENELLIEDQTPGCYIKARYVLAFMSFIGMFNIYSLRTNLSVAIVAMVNQTTDESANDSNICPDKGGGPSSNPSSNGVFNWNSTQQGLILGCYFYGYIFSNIPGAWLSRRYGFRLVLGIAMLFSSVITFCSPIAAYQSFELFVAMRILLGFFQGVGFPVVQGSWSQWAPPVERSFLMSIPLSGSSFGTFVTLPLAGLIADTLGWEAVFYFTGGFAALWSFLWLAIVHNSPSQHPRISQQEKDYIVQSIGAVKKEEKTFKVRTPWLSMLTSLPLLSIVFGHFASNWGNYTLLTMLPTYLATILKFDISQSGAISALPYILQWIFTLGGGFVTDIIRKKGILSTTNIRKINTMLGLGVPALFVVLAGYIGCNASAAVAFFSLSVAFNALTVPGCKASTLELAPKYGGIVYGISNTVANVSGFLAPQVVGLLLQQENNLGQWQVVFWISAGVYVVGAIVYIIFGTSEKQSWAEGKVIVDKDSQNNFMLKTKL